MTDIDDLLVEGWSTRAMELHRKALPDKYVSITFTLENREEKPSKCGFHDLGQELNRGATHSHFVQLQRALSQLYCSAARAVASRLRGLFRDTGGRQVS